MTEGIDDAANAPAIRLIGDCRNHVCSSADGLLEGGVRIVHNHDHPHGTAAERLRTEVQVFGRLVCNPELGLTQRQLSDHPSSFVPDAEQFPRSECCFVEFDCLRSPSNRQHGSDRSLPSAWVLELIVHWNVPVPSPTVRLNIVATKCLNRWDLRERGQLDETAPNRSRAMTEGLVSSGNFSN